MLTSAGPVVHIGGKRNKYKLLVGISEGKKPLGDLRIVCEGILLMWVMKK
jgi:hypothetical protein